MRSQFGSNNPNWRGGIKRQNGYVLIHQPTHPSANINGYVKRAKLVLENELGRSLTKGAVTHHINGIKDDDKASKPRGVICSGT